MKPGYRIPILKAGLCKGLIYAEERDRSFPSPLLFKPSLRALHWEKALMGFEMHRSHWNRGQGMFPPVQAASLQRVSYYRHLPFVENLHGKRGKNAQLANQNVTPNGKILLDLTTGQVGLEPWFGLKGCKDHLMPPPAMSRDTFHCPKLLQTLSHLSLDTSWDGETLDKLGQGLTTHTDINLFPVSNLI